MAASTHRPIDPLVSFVHTGFVTGKVFGHDPHTIRIPWPTFARKLEERLVYLYDYCVDASLFGRAHPQQPETHAVARRKRYAARFPEMSPYIIPVCV